MPRFSTPGSFLKFLLFYSYSPSSLLSERMIDLTLVLSKQSSALLPSVIEDNLLQLVYLLPPSFNIFWFLNARNLQTPNKPQVGL